MSDREHVNETRVEARLYRVGEEPPEAWHWRDVGVAERIEAIERIRREHHGWKKGHEPRLERTARVVEFA